MKTIKQKIEDDMKHIGRNHLNSKISELLDLGVEIAEKKAGTTSGILNIINERIRVYNNVMDAKYKL